CRMPRQGRRALARMRAFEASPRSTAMSIRPRLLPLAAAACLALSAPAAGAASGPAVTVDAAAGVHPISDDIYGMHLAPEALAQELALPVRRWGGNSTTRYNWQIDTYNTGSDWFFENIPNPLPVGRTLPDGSAADQFVEQDRRTGTRTILTIPMTGWVARR